MITFKVVSKSKNYNLIFLFNLASEHIEQLLAATKHKAFKQKAQHK